MNIKYQKQINMNFGKVLLHQSKSSFHEYLCQCYLKKKKMLIPPNKKSWKNFQKMRISRINKEFSQMELNNQTIKGKFT